ncbi:Nuclear matrix protein [Ceraceosorus bombacis]|uniref:Nuclear matrix protein n=1 Tax=Ceraceosorus bombacis TaxID=401625 RepID=A0A0N7L9U6_9BASI|nr:Nuclear matrix protein [Ceraceosorus bombacis]
MSTSQGAGLGARVSSSEGMMQAQQIIQLVSSSLVGLVQQLSAASVSSSAPTSTPSASSSSSPASIPSSRTAKSLLAPIVSDLATRIQSILPPDEQVVEDVGTASDTNAKKTSTISGGERLRVSLKENVGALLRTEVLDQVPANQSTLQKQELDQERPKKRSRVVHSDQGVVELSSDSARALSDRLDVVLAFVDADLVDASLPLQILEEAFEALPIKSCSLLFSYMESRLDQLTVGLSPSKGKGLTLLRLCNDLLRRLSKPSREQTIFAGRVLSTLSAVFPLGERSGVNLRGDFNTDNKTLIEPLPAQIKEGKAQDEEEQMQGEDDGVEAKAEKAQGAIKAESSIGSIASMDLNTTEGLSTICSSPEFYSTFWSLQSIFSNPSLLFDANSPLQFPVPEGAEDPAPDGSKGPMSGLRIATKLTLKVFAAAAKREKILAGAKGSESEAARNAARRKEEEENAKRSLGGTNVKDGRIEAGADFGLQRSENVEEQQDGDAMQTDEDGSRPALPETRKNFFPKYLTGRNLLEYELKDPNFRRHVLVQWLILFQYLLSFTPTQREKWKDWKNKQLQTITFVLDDADDGWIRSCWREIIAQLKAIPPEGKTFSDSVLQTLKRESRWVLWKADNCPPIDLAPLSAEKIIEYAKASQPLLKSLSSYPHSIGTAALSHLWEEGLEPPKPSTRDIDGEQVEDDGLGDLEMPLRIPTLQGYAKLVRAQEANASKRRKQLGWEEAPQDSPDPSALLPKNAEERGKVDKLSKEEKARVAIEGKDALLSSIEDKRRTLAWKALRLASRQHLDLLTSTIRVDDITTLMRLVDEQKKGDEDASPLENEERQTETGQADARAAGAEDESKALMSDSKGGEDVDMSTG